MKLSLIQMNSGQDRDANVARACQFIDQAAQDKPDLIVLPEFFNALYFGQYRDYKYVQWAERDDGYTMTRIKSKAQEHGVYIIATVYEEEAPGIYFDTAMVVDPQGQIVGKYRKTHPAAYRVLEALYYRYGSKYPIFQIQGWKVGVLICYDLFFPEPARCITLKGAELVVAPFAEPAGFLSPSSSNIPADTGEKAVNTEAWYDLWRARMRARALENTVYLAACNHTGQEGEAVFGGGTLVVDPKGRLIAEAGAGEGIITTELDREFFLQVRRTTPFLRDRRPHLYKAITSETEDLLGD
ncbi:MAG TPA: carbon-nitrogen hydrolase family protein [Dehalococcoidia bacterium]|jgi:N-carbamoylputrescine amidase|nr:carbon-nitrogen hydrolase family protein [Dehalococcoidia bacterium]